jgi:hypothetical protein
VNIAVRFAEAVEKDGRFCHGDSVNVEALAATSASTLFAATLLWE